VGSSSQGGCITTNGGCSVAFRMQDPRVAIPGLPATPCNAATPDNPRPGVATVCASTTDGTNTVFGKLELYFSGNSIGHAYLNADPTKPLSLNSVNDLGSTSASKAYNFSLLLTDSNDNPLPTGSTISVVNVTNATAAAPLPATVSDVGLPGSTHSFTITPTSSTTCTAANVTFSVALTTPDSNGIKGSTSTIPFKLTFSCP
jgi:hypothetical protein